MRRRWWLAGLAALCAGPALINVLGRAVQGEDGAAGDVAGRAATYAGRIGLPLPASTKAEFAEWMVGIDAAARLVLVMPEASWAALRSGLPPASFEADGAYLGLDEGSWRPHNAPGLLSAQLYPWRDRAEALNIGFTPATAGEVRVFVFWHQL
ncbi:hypothetical protein [Roseomonas sp. WA12]